jgi:hypothetical protein
MGLTPPSPPSQLTQKLSDKRGSTLSHTAENTNLQKRQRQWEVPSHNSVPIPKLDAKSISPELSPNSLYFLLLSFYIFLPFPLFLFSIFNFTLTIFFSVFLLLLLSFLFLCYNLLFNYFSATFHPLSPHNFTSSNSHLPTHHPTTLLSSTLTTHWLAYCTKHTTPILLQFLT